MIKPIGEYIDMPEINLQKQIDEKIKNDAISVTEKLKTPFDPKVIHWRVGATNVKKVRQETKDQNAYATKAIALAYLDARDVMKRLDDVVGDHWQCEYPFPGCCRIGIKIVSTDKDFGKGAEWIWRSNGAGATDIEGEKGQYSDAFKRAAVMWGIGRYLYYLPNEWVDIKNNKITTPPTLPKWALPK